MKYKASWDSVPTPEEKPFAVVQAGTAASSEALALRHARAMLAVLKASKAFAKASERLCKTSISMRAFAAADVAFQHADTRLMAAVARLERIEKEVRGV